MFPSLESLVIRVLVVPSFEGEELLRQCMGAAILKQHMQRELKLQTVRDLEGLVRRARRRASSETVVSLLTLARDAPTDQVSEVLEALRTLSSRAPKILPVVVIGGDGSVPRWLIRRLGKAGAAEVVIAGEEDAPEALAQRLQTLVLGEFASEFLSAIPEKLGSAPRLLAGALLEQIAAGRLASDEGELAGLCGCAASMVRAEFAPIGGFEVVRTRAALYAALKPMTDPERTNIAQAIFGSWTAFRREWEEILGRPAPDAKADARRALLQHITEQFRSPPRSPPQAALSRGDCPRQESPPPEEEREADTAFSRFHGAVWDRALATAERILGPGPEASEVAWAVVCKMYRRDPQPPISDRQVAYILRSVKNAALDEARRLESEPISLDEVPEGGLSAAPTPERDHEASELRRQVTDALGRMDDSRAAAAFYLVRLHGVPAAEAARWLCVGRRRLQQLLRVACDELSCKRFGIYTTHGRTMT